MAAGLLPRAPDLRRQPLAGRDVMAQRAKRRVLAKSRFEQPVIDGGHAEQHGRLEALHRLGDALRRSPSAPAGCCPRRAAAPRTCCRSHRRSESARSRTCGRSRCSPAPARSIPRTCRRCGDDARPPSARRWCRRSSPRTPDRLGLRGAGTSGAAGADFQAASSRSRRMSLVCGETAGDGGCDELARTRRRSPAPPGGRWRESAQAPPAPARLDTATAMPPAAIAARCIATRSGVSSISMPTRSLVPTPNSRNPAANWLTRRSSAP